MKDYEVKVLDENDHIFLETLRNLGMSRNAAAMVTYLMNVNEASSREIEISTAVKFTHGLCRDFSVKASVSSLLLRTCPKSQ